MLLLLLLAARAEADDVALDALLPAPDQLGFSGFASTRTPGHLGTDATLWLDYGLRLHDATGRTVVRHRFDGTAIAQLGLWSRGAIALRMPFLLVQRGPDLAPGVELASVAAGNPAIDGRVRVLGAKVRPDGSVADGGALALRAVLHAPVGSSQALFADDRFRMDLSTTADIEMFGIGAGIAFAYRYRAPAEAVAEDSGMMVQAPPSAAFNGDAAGLNAHVLRVSAGFRLPLPLLSRAFPGRLQEAGLLELDVQTPTRDLFEKLRTPIEGRLGYRVVVGDLTSTVTFGAGLTDGQGAPDFRCMLGFGWSPRQHDQDADGVPDGGDQCVHLPEDRDGFQDDDGCADDDNDGDLIVDEDDRCPMQPAEMGRDDDEDGCTDA
jgi:hypothetical protein